MGMGVAGNDDRALMPVGYLRTQWSNELDADRVAVDIMAAAGYAPAALLDYVRRTQRTVPGEAGRYSALPSREERISALETAVANLPSRTNPPGGEFKAILGTPWRKVIQEARKEGWKVVHLTMYGVPIQELTPELRNLEKVLLIVGGPKVPGKVYHEADYNVSVTSQPHSEIAALAIALHEIQSGEELKRTFQKSRLRILPSARGKRVVEN